MGSNAIALESLWALVEQHVRVPQDMAVVGFDLVSGSVFTPPLTTMQQPFDQIGAQSIGQLIATIEGRGAHDMALQASLVVRRSTVRTGSDGCGTLGEGLYCGSGKCGNGKG